MNTTTVHRRRLRSPAGPGRCLHRRWLARLLRATPALGLITLLGVVLILAGDGSVAHAADPPTAPATTADSLEAVINNIRTWLFGILVAVATLFLTIGGLRLMWANGDPGEAEKGKAALRSAAIGYALALLAPLIVTIVGGWVS